MRKEIFAMAILSSGIAATADAQMTGPSLADTASSEAVADRPRLDYDAIGIDMGSFVAFSSIRAKLSYDDNVYDTYPGQ